MSINVVKFPEHFAALDIPEALRTLANEIEAGNHGDCYNLFWAIDAGDGVIDVGLMGKSAEPAMTAHFLAAVAQRKIEGNIGNG